MSKTLDRIIFIGERGQENFLNKVKNKTSLSIKELAELIKKSDRTMRDWFRGKYKMPYTDAVKLSRISGVSIPSSSCKEDWKERLRMIGKKGGISHFKKYGRVKVDEKKRKEKWREWWEKSGKYNQKVISKKKKFHTPRISSKLAEFVGVILGDGGISNYQVTITLHRIDDKEYGEFITNLATGLFKVPIGQYKNKNDLGINFIISRVGIVEFLTQKIGLKKGNKVKNQVGIPKWIKNNRNFSIACTRGLIDTDGCLVIHRYKVNGKEYRYKKLCFTNKSKPLLYFVQKVLNEHKIKNRIYKDKDVWVDGTESLNRYMNIFGSHNQKHLMRYKK